MKNTSELTGIKFQSEFTTLWSFAERGSWATHNPNYRGNFAPQVARNIIEMYSDAGQIVLDPMCGGGTTLIECKLLGRAGVGMDINPEAVKLTRKALNFRHTPIKNTGTQEHTDSGIKKTEGGGEKGKTGSILSEDLRPRAFTVKQGDTRNLSFLPDASIDLILTHPPYLNIIRYSDGIEGDLSAISSVSKFCGEMEIVANELHRVLKPDRYCAILMGDTRRGRHFVPLAYRVMQRFLNTGFVLKEDIIKAQHNCSATGRWKWKALKDKFYLIMHEHLFVFRKPAAGENLTRVKDSVTVSSQQ
ncbi:MAG: RNA methyltransferase [Phycisphaerae bacterium]|nr:RNA methyltransferase [Phycisphaerae bacterium]